MDLYDFIHETYSLNIMTCIKLKILIKNLLNIFGQNRNYIISGFKLNIPNNYRLPIYQKQNRLYDRFLPFFFSKFKIEGVIIDIGANIGDTLASIYLNVNNKIVCIEPSDIFSPYLEENVKFIEGNSSNKRVTIINNFIGSGTINSKFVHIDGTTAVQEISNGDSIISVTLDSVVQNFGRIGFIKSDIDGFDYDALLSGLYSINNYMPVLYFENQIDFVSQVNGYNNLYTELINIGYKYFVVFDNFGNLVIENASFETLSSLNTYLLSMKLNFSTRTVYYFDILAFTENDSEVIAALIKDYQRSYIFNY